MKTITLRKIPPEVAKIIRRTADTKGISINKAVVSLLEENLGSKGKKRTLYHDLDYLAGSWTRQEAQAFEKTLARQRAIDEELWN